MLEDSKINSEIQYNKYDIFKRLYYMYMFAGILMLAFCIVQIFKNTKNIRRIINVFHGLIALFFAFHLAGLIVRWYISGHAPWSDAYESMIYVAWATMFFGLAFGKDSKLTVASTAFVTSMILMIAHWNWMDPSIGNLQPVLNSYWLMIHVAVIVGSYGPFTLAMVLGLIALFLMIFTNEKNKAKMKMSIDDLMTELDDARLTAKANGQASAMVAATMSKAKLLGLLDKPVLKDVEPIVNRPTVIRLVAPTLDSNGKAV